MKSRSIVVIAALLPLPATARAQAREQVSPTAAAPAAVSPAQFKGLHWIAGRWRGLGSGRLAAVGAFYEEYSLVDDSTIVMRTADDSTFSRFSDSTRFELRGGTLSAVPARGTTRFATRFAGDSIQWNGPGTLYVRLTNDLWRAVFPARLTDAERPFYELRRMGPGS